VAKKKSPAPKSAAAVVVPPPFVGITQPPPPNVPPGANVTVKALARPSAPAQVAVGSRVDAATGIETPLPVVGGPLAPEVTFNAPAVVGAYLVIIGLADNGTTVVADSAPFSVP
jgi:hypothetical protein